MTEIQVSPKERILGLIEKSTDDALGGKKSFWRSKSYLDHICFDDVMDVVLYYISLQPDRNKIARIESRDFYELLKKVWDEWEERAKKEWGYKYYEHPLNSGKMHRTFKFYDIDSAWDPGAPDTGGSTMGKAAYYAYLDPGFLQHDYLLLFFSYPKGLPDKTGNWQSYRKHNIEELVFPKWRRKMHGKKLEMVFQLAEMVCQRMREHRK